MRGKIDPLILIVLALMGIGVMVSLAHPGMGGTQQSPSVADAFGPHVPAPTNYAVDTTGKLTPEQLEALNAKLKTISDSGKEIAVIMVGTTGMSSIEEFGIAAGDQWKVGKSGKDNGAILIVATEDRKIRIELGRGAEGDITDSQAGDIIRDVIAPLLKKGDWNGGVNAGVDALNEKLH